MGKGDGFGGAVPCFVNLWDPVGLHLTMDVIWLKKDVRLHDHGPLSEVTNSAVSRPMLILYVYEPDQLSHHSMHGSHLHFTNEGLQDFENNIRKSAFPHAPNMQIITFRYGEMTSVLTSIHETRPIGRLLAHMETGHLASYARDTRVKKWTKERNIPFKEFNQTGVTRRLRNRNNFTKNFMFFDF